LPEEVTASPLDFVMEEAVKGVGIDVVDVGRLSRSMQRGSGFAELVFAPQELRGGERHPHPAAYFASCFAAKEALLKALGLGLWQGVPLTDIAVVHIAGAPPAFKLGKKARRALARKNCRSAIVSLGHESNRAVAAVLVQ
jgi:holo-[acyl-carrier protein] synthase